ASGNFIPRDSLSTLSNAMDVGNPSNFARMLALYDGDREKMSHDISAFSFSDDETRTAMQGVFARTHYILDPHGAVAYLGLKQYQEQSSCVGVFFETAHPAKFLDSVVTTLNAPVAVPDRLKIFLSGEKKSTPCGVAYPEFKGILEALPVTNR